MLISVLVPGSGAGRPCAFEQAPPSGPVECEFIAVSEDTDSHDTRVRSGLVAERFRHFSPAALGQARAHRRIWRDCRERGEPRVVVSGDTVLRRDFVAAFGYVLAQLPADWEFLLLGYDLKGALEVGLFPGQDLYGAITGGTDLRAFVEATDAPATLPLNNALGLAAYAVTPGGAGRLLDHCFPLAGVHVALPAFTRIVRRAGSLDLVMNTAYARLRAYTVLPPLAVPVESE